MEEKVTASAHHEHRLKLAKQAKEEKKNKRVLETWHELRPDSSKKLGGKLVKCSRTKAGLHREFVCREKDPLAKELIKKLRDEKKLKVI